MAANTKPIFTLTPNCGALNAIVLTGNTAVDGTGTTVLAFTAGSNGSYIDRVVGTPTGSNVASVMRLFLNNGATPATAGNNQFLGEVSVPANTVSQVSALAPVVFPCGFAIPASYRIYATVGTTIAAGLALSCPGSGDY